MSRGEQRSFCAAVTTIAARSKALAIYRAILLCMIHQTGAEDPVRECFGP